MFAAVDPGFLVLMMLMLALGVGPALLALSSRRVRATHHDVSGPQAAPHRLVFGGATAARYATSKGV